MILRVRTAHGHENIELHPVATFQPSNIKGPTCSSKHKDVHHHAFDQFSDNNRIVPLAEYITQHPSAKTPSRHGTCVVQQRSVLSTKVPTNARCLAQCDINDISHIKSNSNCYQQMKKCTHVQQADVHYKQPVSASQEFTCISNCKDTISSQEPMSTSNCCSTRSGKNLCVEQVVVLHNWPQDTMISFKILT
nr:hypothetical protein [Tanacetum cinerariifolium]